ncbi:hypothetical protein Pan258_21400 [Symmachiella dynata]|uniref:hypothetical protein n=1 Tax=Symmachiella dynata TaxID=2527995 RepID=UPI00118B96C4|nr:hypothetical protein [Symmachiella dynata]QDT48100.1 hypothetical protein Pan258_21400 [Symmachiella dynata]
MIGYIGCIILGTVTFKLGAKAFKEDGIPLTRQKNLTGRKAIIVGSVCCFFGSALFLVGAFETSRIIYVNREIIWAKVFSPHSIPQESRQAKFFEPPEDPRFTLASDFLPKSLSYQPAIPLGLTRYQLTINNTSSISGREDGADTEDAADEEVNTDGGDGVDEEGGAETENGTDEEGSIDLELQTQFVYQWDRKGNEATLWLISLRFTSILDQGLTSEYTADRSSITAGSDYGHIEILPETAVEPEHKSLFVAFSEPVLKLSYNDQGGAEVVRLIEIHRRIREHVAMSLLLHGPYVHAEKSWAFPGHYSMGNGGVVNGEMTFTHVDAASGNALASLTCAGQLDGEMDVTWIGLIRPMSRPFVKKGTYNVTGQMTYDTHAEGWDSAEFSAMYSTEMLNDYDQLLVATKGTENIRLEVVDAASESIDETESPLKSTE